MYKKKKYIAIDCGHGGKDPGAIGLFCLKEKDVVLDIGLKVANLLKVNGFKVFMTRKTDSTMSIYKRIKLINKKNKIDFFISIHANSALTESALGIETFSLKYKLFSFGPSLMSNFEKKVICKKDNLKYKCGQKLAELLQKNIVLAASKSRFKPRNRKVRYSVSRMLLGVNVPGALIEVGFLSNKFEAQMLKMESYRNLIAQGIYNGIIKYNVII